MLNWIKKRLGHHVCEEFTPVEVVDIPGEVVEGRLVKMILLGRRFYFKYCTVCGKEKQVYSEDG